ncbi:MAG: M20/M25/M40 family metallo-hydrolase [Actinomycetes bacterium]
MPAHPGLARALALAASAAVALTASLAARSASATPPDPVPTTSPSATPSATPSVTPSVTPSAAAAGRTPSPGPALPTATPAVPTPSGPAPTAPPGLRLTAEQRALVGAVDMSRVTEHLRALHRIATANGGNRAAGTPGYNASRDYVANRLRRAGYRVSLQPFTFGYYEERTTPVLEQISPERVTYTPAPRDGDADAGDFATMVYSGSGDVTAPVHPVDVTVPPAAEPSSTSGCETSDFTGFPRGAIALIQRGTCEFAVKAANAQAAGAAAVIIFNEGQSGRTGVLRGSLKAPGITIPVVGTSYDIGKDLATADRPVVRVATKTVSETRTTHNVIAESRHGDADKVVMLGAHLDSVPEGPGMNDNASGAAAVLAVAEALGGTKTANRLRFAWWGAEELGLIGSTHYVQTLSDEERERIRLYLNFDMIASPNGAIKIYDGRGSNAGAQPPGSAEIERLFRSHFDAKAQPYGTADLNDRSDYAPFRKAGIPVGGLFTGAGEKKTAEEAKLFGGTAGEPYDACYHRSCDGLTNINPRLLRITTEAIATAAVVYAFAPDPPKAVAA